MRILIAGENRLDTLSLKDTLGRHGHDVEACGDGRTALESLQADPKDLLIADLTLPGLDGIELLRVTREKAPGTAVIIMTGSGTVDTAVEAMRLGAEDYITKPFVSEELLRRIDTLAKDRRRVSENVGPRGPRAGGPRVKLIGTGPAMVRVFETIEMVAPGEAPVLIEGESGTGKQAVARAIHCRSRRAEEPFVAMNCSVLTETLLEDELIGHESGATGRVAREQPGPFERTRGGTHFLDDIDDMKPDLQVKLLQVLQEKSVERLGGSAPIRTDVRVVAASKIDLREEVKRGAFLDDLFVRLNVVNVLLPPLRERLEDIPLLAVHFLNEFARQSGKGNLRLTPLALERLTDHSWPGNVRQLENAMEYAAAAARSEAVTPSDLPPWLKTVTDGDDLLEFLEPGDRTIDLNRSLEKAERALIAWALSLENGNISATSRRLSLPRTTLITRMGRLGLSE
ncbi:MAG: sigma-54-dependent transcriptional regulator [Planctomycetota bacterium]|jgi:DNA-binding NtrC family response regulator